MCHLLEFVCVFTVGVVLLAGCGDSPTVRCEAGVCPCSEQGIRAAIAASGGPYTFDCDGPTTVRTAAEILVNNDVVLDGRALLTIHGNNNHRIFVIPPPVTAELRGLAVTGGDRGSPPLAAELPALTSTGNKTSGPVLWGGGIANYGTLALTSCAVYGNTARDEGGGIFNSGTLKLTNSTVSGNTAWVGGGIGTEGGFHGTALTLINSTVSGNIANSGTGSGISTPGSLTLINVTVSGDISFFRGTLTSANTLIDGVCGSSGVSASNGNNLESPGDTCGFDQESDQVDVSAENLKLESLADNGGPTETHALAEGSVAINRIPEDACLDAGGEPLAADQRGEPRPEIGGSMCDVGAFEVQEGGQ